jgi:hypothetical protein
MIHIVAGKLGVDALIVPDKLGLPGGAPLPFNPVP